MKLYKTILLSALMASAMCACQDKDIQSNGMILAPADENAITGTLNGNDYEWTWEKTEGLDMQVTVYADNTLSASETVSDGLYIHHNINTNVDYTYVFKLTDGKNFSNGVVKHYTRLGASPVTGIMMSQVDKEGGYDAKIDWTTPADATSVSFYASNGTRNIDITFTNGENSYLIPDVNYGEEWNVTMTAENADGKSLPASATLRIGKTAIGFLSAYPTPEELLSNGDDDEASAWLWLSGEYPSATFVYFGDIHDTADLDAYRVLFWIRDLEGVDENAVWNFPSVALDAVPAVKEWYKNGGNLLLWSHAVPYITALGRLDADMLRSNDRAIGTGAGGWNGDTWRMAVGLHPGSRFKKDFSSHPIYKGLETTDNGRVKLIAFKGPGWTEDHNCLFFNIPGVLTGIGNQEEACYNTITEEYGIYPLGVWDSQIDWVSQLNVWEAQQGNTEFTGTVLCIGNGGCEFSLRNADGSADISAYPSNNIYQDNVLTLAKNSLEYLKTR